MFRIVLLASFIVLVFVPKLFAHEEGAPFSAAIIDPLIVHHAHLEDEQRLNFFFSKEPMARNNSRL